MIPNTIPATLYWIENGNKMSEDVFLWTVSNRGSIDVIWYFDQNGVLWRRNAEHTIVRTKVS